MKIFNKQFILQTMISWSKDQLCENYISFIGHFLLDNLKFYSEACALVNGTVLTTDKSRATLRRVAFISTVRASVQNGTVYLNLSESCPTDSLLPERASYLIKKKYHCHHPRLV